MYVCVLYDVLVNTPVCFKPHVVSTAGIPFIHFRLHMYVVCALRHVLCLALPSLYMVI